MYADCRRSRVGAILSSRMQTRVYHGFLILQDSTEMSGERRNSKLRLEAQESSMIPFSIHSRAWLLRISGTGVTLIRRLHSTPVELCTEIEKQQLIGHTLTGASVNPDYK